MRKPLNVRLDVDEIFTTDTGNGTWPLGTRGHGINKRTYRYAKNGATALTQGHLVQQAAPDNVFDGLYVDSTTAEKLNKAVVLNVVSNADIAANEYSDGLLVVVAGAGAGLVLPVTGNTLYEVSASDTQVTVYVEFFPLTDDLTTASKVVLIPNAFKGVIQTEVPVSQEILGVTPVDVGANAWFWLQTSGPAAVLQQDDLAPLAPVTASELTRGAVQSATQVVPEPLAGSMQNAEGHVVVPVLQTKSGALGERLATTSGLAVVQGTRIGTCLASQLSGEFAIVNLDLE